MNKFRGLREGDPVSDVEGRLMRFLASPEDEERFRAEAAERERKAAQRLEELESARLFAAGFGLREVEAARRFKHAKCDTVMERLEAGGLVFVYGDCGSGKTVGVCWCALHWRRGSVRYLRAIDFFLGVKGCWHRDSRVSEEVYLEGLRGAGLLVIDELQDRGKGSPWEDGLLANVIDHRYSRMLPTVVVSNRSAEETRDEVTRSVISRVQESGVFVHFDNASFRGRRRERGRGSRKG